MKQVLLVLMLSLFAAIGVAHVFRPEWFLSRAGVRKGGELLNEWNRLGFQIAGAVFAAFALYLLYVLFRG
jgi:hypothetical protein